MLKQINKCGLKLLLFLKTYMCTLKSYFDVRNSNFYKNKQTHYEVFCNKSCQLKHYKRGAVYVIVD